MTSSTHLILFAHGSRDDQWKAPFESLQQELKASLGNDRVHLAYMEMTTPVLTDAFEATATRGATEVVVLPLFMASGGHLRHDVPRQVEDARARYPDLQIDLRPPIGEHPEVRNAIQLVATNTLHQA